eukprot:GHVU01015193.1.p1 GENE.GHVU01015193.1~~GHVU01015193.1.p1  ORF type:complete len:126 (+),score=7.67 GHVU01015193.1:115-492(+)
MRLIFTFKTKKQVRYSNGYIIYTTGSRISTFPPVSLPTSPPTPTTTTTTTTSYYVSTVSTSSQYNIVCTYAPRGAAALLSSSREQLPQQRRPIRKPPHPYSAMLPLSSIQAYTYPLSQAPPPLPT